MWKKHKLVMLPTEKKANNQIVKSINHQLLGIYQTRDDKYNQWIGQNLYILSDDEIKEGDYYMNSWGDGIPLLNKCNSFDEAADANRLKHCCKKVIATTDELEVMMTNPAVWDAGIKTKSLPQLSQQFIEKFVDEYNKGNIISDVMVEYDTISVPYVTGDGFEIVLKINQDNTINIKTVKDSWSRDEVVGILEKFNDRFGSLSLIGDFKSQDRPKFNKWVEENL